MTDNQNGAAPEPTAPEPQTTEAETMATPAAATPAAEAPAAPATPAAAEAPATPAAPAAAAAAPAAAPEHAAPAAPTGTVYAPGQAPQPYHAPQYSHQPSYQTQPTTPLPYGAAPGQPHAAQTQPTQPLGGSVPPGSVPPAFGGPAQPAEPKPERRRVGFGVAAAIVATALVAGAGGAGISALIINENQPAVSTSAGTPQNIVVNDPDSVNQITAVAAAASPSVVTISVSSQQGAGTGSGVILSEDGYVLTNTHVVTLDGATGDPAIQVKTSDGRLWNAELVGTDPLSDLAVIKLVDASDLKPLEFADSDKLNVGDAAIAIGAPLGLSGTVTNGIVSALNRSIDVASSAAPATPDDGDEQQQPQQESPFDFWNFDVPGQEGQEGQQQAQSGGTISIPVVQTDAAINPGNSGGALLDAGGKLIGINVAILSAGGSSGEAGNIGVGFAVPSNLAKRVSSEIIADGEASHGLLGATVTSAQAADDATEVGALITELTPNGAAAAAGLKEGDVVTSFNGVPIADQTDLTAQVRAQAGGSDATVTYTRDGKSATVDVTLGTFEG